MGQKYLSCERELRAMTEELEKVKLELKDTKEILKLKDELVKNDLDEFQFLKISLKFCIVLTINLMIKLLVLVLSVWYWPV